MNKLNEIDRRQFLIDSAKRYLGVSVAPMLGASLATPSFARDQSSVLKPKKMTNSVIFLNMAGGMSHVDTFDLKQSKSTKIKEQVQGPVKGINTKIDGYQVSEYLPQTAKVIDKCTVINSMTSTNGDHNGGQYLLHKNYSKVGTITHPSVGSWVTNMAGKMNDSLPGYVGIMTSGQFTSGGWMGGKYSAANVGNPDHGLKNIKRFRSVDESEFDRRLKVADLVNNRFHEKYANSQVEGYQGVFQEAVNTMKSDDLEAFDISKEPKSIQKMYGKSQFSKGCLLARRLVEVGVRYVEVTLHGWDSHYDNFTVVEERCNSLDQAYAALIKDLDQKGLLDTTMVILSSEFGRTNIDAKRKDGRHHHPGAFSTIIAGGGTKQGYVHGATDERALSVESNPVTIYDINATIGYAFGIDYHRTFYSKSGRPFKMSGPDKHTGSPVEKIFA